MNHLTREGVLGAVVVVQDTEGWGSAVVLEDVPEGVSLLESLAGNGGPVVSGVVGGSDSLVLLVTGGWPSSLGDPNPSIWVNGVDTGADLVHGVPEKTGSNIDAVGLSGLVVWVTIGGDKVASCDNLVVVGNPLEVISIYQLYWI